MWALLFLWWHFFISCFSILLRNFKLFYAIVFSIYLFAFYSSFFKSCILVCSFATLISFCWRTWRAYIIDSKLLPCLLTIPIVKLLFSWRFTLFLLKLRVLTDGEVFYCSDRLLRRFSTTAIYSSRSTSWLLFSVVEV